MLLSLVTFCLNFEAIDNSSFVTICRMILTQAKEVNHELLFNLACAAVELEDFKTAADALRRSAGKYRDIIRFECCTALSVLIR